MKKTITMLQIQHQVLICYFDKFNGFGIKTIERFICATKVINDRRCSTDVRSKTINQYHQYFELSQDPTRPSVFVSIINNIPK